MGREGVSNRKGESSMGGARIWWGWGLFQKSTKVAPTERALHAWYKIHVYTVNWNIKNAEMLVLALPGVSWNPSAHGNEPTWLDVSEKFGDFPIGRCSLLVILIKWPKNICGVIQLGGVILYERVNMGSASIMQWPGHSTASAFGSSSFKILTSRMWLKWIKCAEQ